ncbi:histidine kinase [Paenibacillus sp.]|uniref:sensor histidine kinase n=1 Tax=Paenibacillus sp. TaxID=58172 RepID=UPI002811F504|nr:histidine kinase [Paenibacillus sp.]
MVFIESIRRSIKWKMIAMITLVLLSVVVSVVYFTYYQTKGIIEKDARQFSNQILNQVNMNVDRYLRGFQLGFLSIASNSDTERWLRVEAGDDLSSYIIFQEIINNYLQVFIYQHPEVLSITFSNTNGNEMHFTNGFELVESYDFENERYMDKLEGQHGIYFDVTFSDNYVQKNLPVMTMVKQVTVGQEVGYIKLDIDLRPVVGIVNENRPESSGLTLISDAEGRIIAHPDLQLVTSFLEQDLIERLSAGSGSFYREASDEIMIFQTVPLTSWKVISLIPYYEFAESVLYIRGITIAAVLVGLALLLITIIAILSSFTRRIGVMKKIMTKAKIGNFHDRIPVEGIDEIADLGHTYNSMLNELETSIHQLAESKLQRQEATMSALQSQIDSHFLYNSLEAINSMANLADHKEIEQMTVALSRMLRYTSDYKSTIVTVEDELRHLQNYLQINRIRFGEKLSFRIRLEAECAGALCLKAVIQPVVENCIKHNLERNGKPLRIEVKVRCLQREYVQIAISDNGVGFSEERLKMLERQIHLLNSPRLKEHSSRIGLLNVHSRLRVYYAANPNTGVFVSNPSNGTGALVSVVFPLQYREKEAGA